MSLQTLLLSVHLLGCVFGVGASTILDLRVVSLLGGRRVSGQDLAFVRLLSLFTRIGLLLLWLSGLCFLSRYWFSAPELLTNPKLHAKVAIVLTLTLNGLLVELFALPFLVRQRGRALFDGLPVQAQVGALIVGVVSATGWYGAFALGLLREWNFVVPATTILTGYSVLVTAGCCAVILARQVLYSPRSSRHHPFA